jgi:ubiquinone/menaquinone biosynthesis C-methylase UbiE
LSVYAQTVSYVYTHGHHESVLRSHSWRTAENSAGYLLGSLGPGQRILDVGCGPGTITLDLARRVAPGEVLGIDSDPGVVAKAEALARTSDVDNATFQVGDAYNPGFDDRTFDVVHAHQVLQHLTDPERALRSLWRILRPGGTLAVRDSDYGGFVWSPADPALDRWMELYQQITKRNGACANAGRYLLSWVQAAGYQQIRFSSSTWTFADPESRAWWGGLWADRVEFSAFAEQAISYGLSNQTELHEVAAAWRRWIDQPGGCFVVVHGEILAAP